MTEMTTKNKSVLSAVICIFICLLPILVGFILYGKLPDQLPIHYSIEGDVDKTSGKLLAILLLPAICAILELVIALLLWPVSDKSPKLYTSVLIIGPLLSCSIQAVTLGNAFGFSINPMTITMIIFGILFIVLGNYLPTVRPNGFMGARFPWIMDDDYAWEKTQRFTGKLMLIMGIIYLLDAFLNIGGENGAIAFILAGVFVMLIVSGVYSYIVANRS